MKNEIAKIQLPPNRPAIIQEKVTHKKNIFQRFKDLSQKPYFEDIKRGHPYLLFCQRELYDYYPRKSG